MNWPEYTRCPIKKANFPPILTLGARRISNAPNVKGGKFAFLFEHPVDAILFGGKFAFLFEHPVDAILFFVASLRPTALETRQKIKWHHSFRPENSNAPNVKFGGKFSLFEHPVDRMS